MRHRLRKWHKKSSLLCSGIANRFALESFLSSTRKRIHWKIRSHKKCSSTQGRASFWMMMNFQILILTSRMTYLVIFQSQKWWTLTKRNPKPMQAQSDLALKVAKTQISILDMSTLRASRRLWTILKRHRQIIWIFRLTGIRTPMTP